MMKFKRTFDKYACWGDTLTLETRGWTVTARIEPAPETNIDDDDCHNVDQSVTGHDDEQQEKLLAARQAWSEGMWHYCGIVVTASKHDVELGSASLWGIELNYPGSDNSYLTDIANELLVEALARGRKTLASEEV